MKPFSIVVAFDSEYGIGKNGGLAWHLPADLKHFKEVTSHLQNPSKQNAVIMGRKTWDSLPERFRPLPGRFNVVLTTGTPNLPQGVLGCQSLDEALAQMPSSIENVFVIGGAQIYAYAINHPACEKLYVTHVQGNYSCDAFFPAISPQFFPIAASEKLTENGTMFQFCEYIRNI